MHPYSILADCPKLLPPFNGWAEPNNGQRSLFFETPIIIGGVIEEGFTLKGVAKVLRPNASVTFELRLSKKPARGSFALVRACWRSLKGGHTNQPRYRKQAAPMEKKTTASHFHPFSLNWDRETGRALGDNLPLAESISDPISSYDEFLKFVGKSFNISNISIVKSPPWEYNLSLLGENQ